MRKSNFSPIVTVDTQVLILGSLPGDASLVASRYYAHPQNRFWHLAGAVIAREDLPELHYEVQLETLLAAGVGLWDTVASAERDGSMDAAIRNPKAAPLIDLIVAMPRLRAIAFNGATAARIGRRALGETELTLIDLPSSSPAHAAIRYDGKLERWAALKQFLI